jgi:hypothetical protein
MAIAGFIDRESKLCATLKQLVETREAAGQIKQRDASVGGNNDTAAFGRAHNYSRLAAFKGYMSLQPTRRRSKYAA